MVSLIYDGKLPQPPKIKIGTKIQSIVETYNGSKVFNGTIISNNTIDFATLDPLYDIKTEISDENGKCIIMENIPEILFS